MSQQISMHAARTALNSDPELRRWAEQRLKDKEREVFMSQPGAAEEAFEKHWMYVRPERMHEGAIEAVSAYRQQNEAH